MNGGVVLKQNARTSITEAFKDLLNTQSIDKLTIKELCNHSYVNRHTFYYYFTDLLDIFKHIIFEELTEEIANNKTFDTWEAGFLATMNYLKKNSKMMLNIYRSSYWPEANVFLSDMSNKLVGGVVMECIAKMKAKLNRKDRLFIIDFYRYVFNGWMLNWLSKGMDEEPDAILKKLLMMVTDMSCAVALFDEAENTPPAKT